MRTQDASTGRYGDGLVCGPDGLPLRPGGAMLTETLLDLARFAPGALVVDVGCGQGTGVEALLRRAVQAIGVDNRAETLDRARLRLADGVFLQAEATDLPFAAASVDGILAECSLSTMPDRAAVLREWWRVLADGGRLALSDVYRRAPGPDRPAAPSPMVTWSRLAADLTEAGFEIEWFEDCSEVLKSWVARFVFEYGSLEALWGGECGLNAESVRQAAPGYFVLIADKRPHRRETMP